MRYLFLFIVIFVSCKSEQENETIKYTHSLNGGMSDIFVNEDNEILLTWIEFLNDSTDALFLTHYKNNNWSDPIELNRGNNWFVNWADFPTLAQFNSSKKLAYHWLQKSDTGTYDYDVMVSAVDIDNPQSQSERKFFKLHQDTVMAEHGFVSLKPFGQNVFATWLDGRQTKSHEHEKGLLKKDDHHHHGEGAMNLRAATINASFEITDNDLLDASVCDCCQTDAVITDKGPLVVYRDRSQNEIRDISYVRWHDGKWTEPKSVYNDDWKIAGCPVNGPAVSVHENQVAVVWYSVDTIVGPNVKCAFSNDYGQNFETPFVIDDTDPLGRVDIVSLSKNKWTISYLDIVDSTAVIKLSSFNQDGELLQNIDEVISSESRSSGFPIIEKFMGKLILSWTNVENDSSKVQTHIYNLNTSSHQ